MSVTESWLYGSVARGTHGAESDLDVLVVADNAVPIDQLLDITEGLPQQQHLALRQYSWGEVEQMSSYGSLFLLHVKLEGRLLDSRGGSPRLQVLLEDLPPYQLEHRDLEGFVQALEDVGWSLGDEGDTAFELAVIATVVRHCSILACYKMGQPTFDTRSSVEMAFKRVGMASASKGAVDLYSFRLAQSRRLATGVEPVAELAYTWLGLARRFVERVGALR